MPAATSLRCYQCGQYTDGVGSITPCINYTERLHLKECPASTSLHCIKYVTEGSVVRDCAAQCTEKFESWGTKIYCCTTDGCNSATTVFGDLLVVITVTLLTSRILQRSVN